MTAQPVTERPEALVIGASFAGLFAAAALARAGRRVTVIERDILPAEPVGRPGVPQSIQPHVLLHRCLLAAEAYLPGLAAEMEAVGGRRFRTSRMAWLSALGWMPQTDLSYELITLSRPLLEQLVRRRVRAEPAVSFREGERVTGLARGGAGWTVHTAAGAEIAAPIVVDASGRSSRLPHWLADAGLPVPAPDTLDARLGYAMRIYRGDPGLRTGVVLVATPEHPVAALALPIENDTWILLAAGYGNHRPGRSAAEYEAALAGQRDPCIADLARQLTPVSDVVVHRQTANRRHAYGLNRSWPPGLLVLGDALCALDPVYGHGITIAAIQAGLLLAAPSVDARLQRRVRQVSDLPWSIATSEDRRMPSSPVPPSRVDRVSGLWTRRMVRLATAGDAECQRAFGDFYHLMKPPSRLLAPGVVRAVLGSLVRGVGPSADRPATLPPLAS